MMHIFTHSNNRHQVPVYWLLPRCRGNQAAFTLLEILVSILILATVLSTIFASYTGTFRIVSETEGQARIYEMARTAFERMLEDLESLYLPVGFTSSKEDGEDFAYAFEGKDDEINGDSADAIRFSSRAHLTFREEDQSGETATIHYYVEQKDNTAGLTLFRSDTMQTQESAEEDGRGIPLCENLAFVDFKYTDVEDEEHDGWDPEDGIPKMVTISLGFANPSDPETPLKFITRIALAVHPAEEKME